MDSEVFPHHESEFQCSLKISKLEMRGKPAFPASVKLWPCYQPWTFQERVSSYQFYWQRKVSMVYVYGHTRFQLIRSTFWVWYPVGAQLMGSIFTDIDQVYRDDCNTVSAIHSGSPEMKCLLLPLNTIKATSYSLIPCSWSNASPSSHFSRK